MIFVSEFLSGLKEPDYDDVVECSEVHKGRLRKYLLVGGYYRVNFEGNLRGRTSVVWNNTPIYVLSKEEVNQLVNYFMDNLPECNYSDSIHWGDIDQWKIHYNGKEVIEVRLSYNGGCYRIKGYNKEL